MNPNATVGGNNHCYIVGGNTGSNTCHGYWSQQPQQNPCSIPGPSSWAPVVCNSVPFGPKLWQYRIQDYCGGSYDFNMSTPAGGDDETFYMLYIY